MVTCDVTNDVTGCDAKVDVVVERPASAVVVVSDGLLDVVTLKSHVDVRAGGATVVEVAHVPQQLVASVCAS